MRLYVVGALGCGALAHLAHLALDEERAAQHALAPLSAAQLQQTLPSTQALRLLALGHYELVADSYFLRAVLHFGDAAMHRYAYPNLAPYLFRAIGLDPLFCGAYQFAGEALATAGARGESAQAILEQGMQRRPDSWHIAFLLGFVAYHFNHDYVRAARALKAAALLPGAPPVAGLLALRLAAAAHAPEVGLTLVDAMLAQTQLSQQARAPYIERRNLLLLEVAIQTLQHACDVFRIRYGQAPKDFAELLAVGLVQEIPDDPLGGHFALAVPGIVTTAHQALRLTLHAPPSPPG